MREGHLLGHVRDLGSSSDDPNTRIYQTRERQTFHTDSCDVVGLMCLQTAKSGGLSSLVSSTTIFNEMRRRRPDLLRVLMEPIETDRRGEVPEGGKPYFNIPVFNYHDGLVSTIYQRQYIESARRFPGVAPLTPSSNRSPQSIRRTRKRSAAKPDDGTATGRHSARAQSHDPARSHRIRGLPRARTETSPVAVWLAPRGARPLPEVYAERFGSITPGDRGGVVVPGSNPTIPFE